jgi:hypothetical protein
LAAPRLVFILDIVSSFLALQRADMAAAGGLMVDSGPMALLRSVTLFLCGAEVYA